MSFWLISTWALGLVGPLAHDRATDCGRWFGAPPRIEGYSTRVDSGPIFRQVMGTCRFEAALGHIQNLTGVAFSSDYLAIKRMKKTAVYIIESMANGYTDKLNQQPGYIDTLECEYDSPGFWSTMFRIELENGLLPAIAFGYRPEFAREMREWADHRGVRHTGGPMTLVQLLDVRVGLILQHMKDRLHDEDRPTLARLAMVETKALFERALAGANPTFNAETITQYVLTERKRIEVGSECAWLNSTSADAETTLVRELDAGRNVVLHSVWRGEHFDARDATFRARGDVEAEREFAMANQKNLPGHAIVIDGYARDAHGNLEWLLLKDSQGTDHGDRGFIHMHIDYFRGHAVSVNALGERR